MGAGGCEGHVAEVLDAGTRGTVRGGSPSRTLTGSAGAKVEEVGDATFGQLLVSGRSVVGWTRPLSSPSRAESQFVSSSCRDLPERGGVARRPPARIQGLGGGRTGRRSSILGARGCTERGETRQ